MTTANPPLYHQAETVVGVIDLMRALGPGPPPAT